MKKVILLMPFILMACKQEESSLEKEYRLAKEKKEAIDQQYKEAMEDAHYDSLAEKIKKH